LVSPVQKQEAEFLLCGERYAARTVTSQRESEMQLVRFGDRRTGLVVDLDSGPHVIDVVASVGALLPYDPISNGVLNGILREAGSWAPLIEHWSRVSVGLRRLVNLALKVPDHPHLVLRTYQDAQIMLRDPSGIAVLEIPESRKIQSCDPTGWASITAQCATALASPAKTHSAADLTNAKSDDVVIGFPGNEERGRSGCIAKRH
jgi:hypothetical protein